MSVSVDSTSIVNKVSADNGHIRTIIITHNTHMETPPRPNLTHYMSDTCKSEQLYGFSTHWIQYNMVQYRDGCLNKGRAYNMAKNKHELGWLGIPEIITHIILFTYLYTLDTNKLITNANKTVLLNKYKLTCF